MLSDALHDESFKLTLRPFTGAALCEHFRFTALTWWLVFRLR